MKEVPASLHMILKFYGMIQVNGMPALGFISQAI
jgi:hypothetical protein